MSCSHRCSVLCPCISPCAKSVWINFHTLSHTGSHRCVLLPRRMACLCVFMAVSSDVSQPLVTQSSGFSLFVPLNSLQCTDVTEQLREQETGGGQMTQGKSCQSQREPGTKAPAPRPMAYTTIIKGNLMMRWKSGNTTDGNKKLGGNKKLHSKS